MTNSIFNIVTKKYFLFFIVFFLIVRISFPQCVSNTTNGSFEQPVLTDPAGWHLYNESLVPDWNTTASDNLIEIWDATITGIPAYSGNQFAELNAVEVSTLYIDVCTPCADTVKWEFAHRGRLGVDVCNLKAGPPGGPYTIVTTASDNNTAWGFYSGKYVVPVGQTVTRFEYESVSASGANGDPSHGNLLDAVSFVFSGLSLPSPPIHTNILCNGDKNGTAAIITSGGGPFTYLWNTTPVQTTAIVTNLNAGSYSVTVSNSVGCTTMKGISITQPALLTASVIVHTDASCNGVNNGSATVAGNGGTLPYSYLWNNGQTNTAATGLMSGINSVIVTDANGCIASTTVNIGSLDPLPLVSFIADDTVGCPPLCVNFTNTSPDAVTSIWNFGDGTSSGFYNASHCYNVTGNYSVTVTITSANGCINSVTKNNYIKVDSVPVANFLADPVTTTLLLGSTISFTDQSLGAIQWQWNFGNIEDSSSVQQNTQFTYTDIGEYRVQLVIVNNYGCTDSISKVIYIRDDIAFYVPNSFTPNGDGKNDCFIPSGYGINPDRFEMLIFNRWGNLIYRTDRIDKPWNGIILGGKNNVQIDTYVWKIAAETIYGEKIDKIGHVNLIR